MTGFGEHRMDGGIPDQPEPPDGDRVPRSRVPRQGNITENVHKVVLQELIPAQICQLILDISHNK